MALQILREGPKMDGLIADRRLYLTADKGRVVEEGAPDAAYLFAVPGTPIEAGDVALHGLTMVDGQVVVPAAPAPEDDAEVPEKRGTARRKRDA
jgi:hypothetical protein